MLEVKFYDKVCGELIKFVVIISRYQEKWVYVRHKQRDTLEIPGGHRESGESVYEAAERELREETGVTHFDMKAISVYSVKGKTRVNKKGEESYGMLFYADLFHLGEIRSEIAEVILCDSMPKNLTYPETQSKLMEYYLIKQYTT